MSHVSGDINWEPCPAHSLKHGITELSSVKHQLGPLSYRDKKNLKTNVND